ncbi:hypothetical protein TWF730_008038 [Orbilia blumenaviensis]|uniref:F-box domain-containing protein n=1 Tax=Orbilia blumenaviensis TaxID=1796055 RepID=A0AAV9V9V9_9PEZI
MPQLWSTASGTETTTVPNINSIPSEILNSIFDSLGLLDEIVASQVCLLWQEIFRNRLKATKKRYKRFYCSPETVPQRIHRLLLLNDTWFLDHENPAKDENTHTLRFFRGSKTLQSWLKFTIKDFHIDRYIVKSSVRRNGVWEDRCIDITDHSVLDESLFSSGTIEATQNARGLESYPPGPDWRSYASEGAIEVLSRLDRLNDIITPDSQKVISYAKNRVGMGMISPYANYNQSKGSVCGCRMKMCFALNSPRYLKMTLREFLQDIWEQAKVWVVVYHAPVIVRETWPENKPLKMANFPDIKSVSVELTYGWADDMIVVLRGVRADKTTYKDGCDRCKKRGGTSEYLCRRDEKRELKLPSGVSEDDIPDRKGSYNQHLSKIWKLIPALGPP